MGQPDPRPYRVAPGIGGQGVKAGRRAAARENRLRPAPLPPEAALLLYGVRTRPCFGSTAASMSKLKHRGDPSGHGAVLKPSQQSAGTRRSNKPVPKRRQGQTNTIRCAIRNWPRKRWLPSNYAPRPHWTAARSDKGPSQPIDNLCFQWLGVEYCYAHSCHQGI